LTNEVQQAREALGYRLADLRKDARVSGRQLAALAGWHFTKVSKIEHGRSRPSEADIELWCFHCGAENQIADLTAAARGVEKMYVELKRLLRAGTTRYQQELLDEETRTRHFRIFDPAVIPGALQTPGYATVRLSEFADMVGIPPTSRPPWRSAWNGPGCCSRRSGCSMSSWASTRCARPWPAGT
jgi:transcriptional regulator with XRE-family HTH domain